MKFDIVRNVLIFMYNATLAGLFGLNPSDISNFIKQYNLKLIEDVGVSYYQENYLKPIGRKLNVSLIERISYAKIDSK